LVGTLRCGSSPTPEAKSPDASESEAGDEPEEASDTDADDSDASDAADAAPAAPADPCADGSCFACGTGFCPAGFYCDESAQGGPGCGWLPACAPKMGCGCLDGVMSGCTCSESGGAPHLTCG
jgi:hypothetical protein